MSHLIKIKRNTSILDLNQFWVPLEANDDVVFEVSKSSSFELFAEGVALGFLKEMKNRGHRIEIKFHTSANRISIVKLNILKSLEHPQFKDLIELNIPEILCGIFGMQLLFQASMMLDVLLDEENGAHEVDGRNIIGSSIWSVIQKNRGQLGDGKRQYLFSRHDYMVPKVLRETDHITFPKSETFRRKVVSIIKKLGNEKIEEQEKKELISSWLFHIAENAHEHGAVDVFEGDKVYEEYRGILLEKLAITNFDALKKRKDISENVRGYLFDLWDNHGLSKNSSMTIATVMDGGVGIQNSISVKSSNTSSLTKLESAFSRGKTRRSKKIQEAGYGLYDSVRLTRKLKACVVLSTGNLFLEKTFNDINNNGLYSLEDHGDLNKSVGTAFSLIWPSLLDSPNK
jgi:hypothetical protein